MTHRSETGHQQYGIVRTLGSSGKQQKASLMGKHVRYLLDHAWLTLQLLTRSRLVDIAATYSITPD